jgi:hypothetical protein
MRKLAITLAVSTTFVLAATAFAALPTSGAFAGKTSLHPINGFPDLVTFASTNGGRALKKFTFQTLGCFGTGPIPVGVNPYGQPDSIGVMPTVPVTATGTFQYTATAKFNPTVTTITTATIKGAFLTPKFLTGTITITQTLGGDKCGPSTMKFTAVPGTPASLGYTG